MKYRANLPVLAVAFLFLLLLFARLQLNALQAAAQPDRHSQIACCGR